MATSGNAVEHVLATITPRSPVAPLKDLQPIGYTAHIDAAWGQGRTTFGGISAAVAVKAAALAAGESLPLRSVLTTFVAPTTAGDVTCEVTPLRMGRSVTTMEAKVMQGNSITTNVVASFGAARETRSVETSIKPQLPPNDATRQWDTASPLRPKFLQNFDIRFLEGQPGAKESFGTRRSRLWIRAAGQTGDAVASDPSNTAATILAIADMPPPIMILHYEQPTVASSLSWSFEFVKAPETVRSEFFYLDYELIAASNGYSQQNGCVFDDSGDLVALSRQNMVYFEPAAPKL